MSKEETTTMVKSSIGLVTENLVVIKEELIGDDEGSSSDEMTDGEFAYRENMLIEKEVMEEKLIKEELIEKGLIKQELIEEDMIDDNFIEKELINEELIEKEVQSEISYELLDDSSFVALYEPKHDNDLQNDFYDDEYINLVQTCPDVQIQK